MPDNTRYALADLIYRTLHPEIQDGNWLATLDATGNVLSHITADAVLARWRLVPVEKPRSGTPSWSPRIAYPHDTPIPCYEDDLNRCACETCINEPKVPGKRPLSL